MHSTKNYFVGLLLVAIAAFTSCRKEKPAAEESGKDSAEVPVLPERVEPYPNNTNFFMVTLGRVLFYDKELSVNKNVACGSCHKQENAFSDNLKFSPGTNNELTERNTPSIFAKAGRMFWDGRAVSVNDLALRPVTNPVEMGHRDMNALVNRISSLDYYKALFAKAFPSRTSIDTVMIQQALAEFMRSFRFNDNKFQRSQLGQEKLTDSEERGRQLFFSEAKCSQCHHIQDNGFNGYGGTDESHNIGLDHGNPDPGVGAISRISSQEGSFMMPVLLNVELTAPYMHDGRFQTLEEVVEHYNSKIQANPNLDPKLRNWDGTPLRLNLSESDKTALVDFLKTLTDRSILTDKRYSNPFVARRN